MSQNYEQLEQAKARVTFPDAITLLQLTLKEAELTTKDDEGKEIKLQTFRGKCPVCGGNDRSLSVTPAKGFMCFASSQDPKQRAKGKDVVALAAHIRKCGQRDAAQWLLDTARGGSTQAAATGSEKGLKPLDHIQPEHERTQEIIDAETAIVLGVGYTSKGPMRDTVAVPCYDLAGVRLAYLGIQEDGTYRLYPGFPYLTHLFNAHQAMAREVQLVATVQDVLQLHEQGISDAVCFLTPTVSHDQLRVLMSWLADNDRVLVL